MISHGLQGLEVTAGRQWSQLKPRKPYPPGSHPLLGGGRKSQVTTSRPSGGTAAQPLLGEGVGQKAGKRRGAEEPHVFVVHGRQHGLADGGGVGMEPKEGEQLSGPSGLGAGRGRQLGIRKLLT